MVVSTESRIKKIQGLLAKAFDNPSEEEAKSALLLAQKLMVQWNIDASQVEGDKNKKEKVTREQYDLQSIRAEWKLTLAQLIANNFRCKLFLHGIERPYLVFLGLAADAKVAKEIYGKTLEFMMKGRDRCYLKLRNANKDAKGSKGDYVRGFLVGLAEAFKHQVDEQGWGLMLVTSPEVQKVFESIDFSEKQSKFKPIFHKGNKEAQLMGYVDGKSQIPDKRKKKLTGSVAATSEG